MLWTDITRMTETHKNKKEIFSEIINYIYSNIGAEDEIKLSLLKNDSIIEELKTLQIIEIDDLESCFSYLSYDHFLIFKLKDYFYFCDTDIVISLGVKSIIKMLDFNQYFRKDKIERIQKIESK